MVYALALNSDLGQVTLQNGPALSVLAVGDSGLGLMPIIAVSSRDCIARFRHSSDFTSCPPRGIRAFAIQGVSVAPPDGNVALLGYR